MNRSVVVVTLALAVVCWGCGPSPAPSRVRVGVDVDAGGLDPRLMRDTTAYRAVNLLFDGLVEIDAELQARPGLATHWDNPDPTTWIFHLREGVRFHDGTPVTADDVIYTFETILDPALKAPLRSLYTPIHQIEALDELTVKMSLSEPYAPMLSYLDMGIVPKRALEEGLDLNTRPTGTGPFKLERWDKGSKIMLQANPDFWDGKPGLERIELVVVPDNTARAQAFEAGDLDLIQSPLSPQDIQRLADDPRFVTHLLPGIAVTYLNFNVAVPHLSDSRMRRALTMLVDQDTIIEQIYEGTDEKATSILLPASWAYQEEIRQPSTNPGEADRLLSELGWRDSDGDRVLDKDGKKLVVELGTHSEDVNRVQTVELLQNTFSRHGIETRVNISDWASFSVRRDAGDYEVILLGWTQLVDPDRLLYDQLHSAGGLNWGRYKNAELDGFLEEGRSVTTREERAAAYHQAAKIIAEEVPYYILSYQGYQVFSNPRLEGFEPDPRGMLRSLAKANLRN